MASTSSDRPCTARQSAEIGSPEFPNWTPVGIDNGRLSPSIASWTGVHLSDHEPRSTSPLTRSREESWPRAPSFERHCKAERPLDMGGVTHLGTCLRPACRHTPRDRFVHRLGREMRCRECFRGSATLIVHAVQRILVPPAHRLRPGRDHSGARVADDSTRSSHVGLFCEVVDSAQHV